jgi:hypothetical protein
MVSFNILLIPIFFITLLIKYKSDICKWKSFLNDWLPPILISSPLFLVLST